MTLDTLLLALEHTDLAMFIREDDAACPWIESIHVLAITLVVGTIWMLDLRLIGWGSLERSVTAVSRAVLPCTWAAFAFAAISGGLLFASNATGYAHNNAFLAKFCLIGLAGINMLVFQKMISGQMEQWAATVIPHAKARLAGAISLVLWVSVIACGRWVGFTLKQVADSAG